MPVSQDFINILEYMRELCTIDIPQQIDLDKRWKDLTDYWFAEYWFTSEEYAFRLAYHAVLELARRKEVSTDTILDTIKDMHERKNAGYAGLSTDPFANFRHATLFNVTAHQGCLVRLADKYYRYCNLRQNPELDKVQESIEDTLLDLASYALIAQVLKDEENKIC
jgi:NTP pyrophosphatase (non-canonical NTP hydrolase)